MQRYATFKLSAMNRLGAAAIGGLIGFFLGIVPTVHVAMQLYSLWTVFATIGGFAALGAAAVLALRQTWDAQIDFVEDRIVLRNHAQREKSVNAATVVLVVTRPPIEVPKAVPRSPVAIYTSAGARLLFSPLAEDGASFARTLQEAAPTAVYITAEGEVSSRRRPNLDALLPLLKLEGRSQLVWTAGFGGTLLFAGVAILALLLLGTGGSAAFQAGYGGGWMIAVGAATLWRLRRVVPWVRDREQAIRKLTGTMLTCSKCGYDFERLPERAPCPECGAPRPANAYKPRAPRERGATARGL